MNENFAYLSIGSNIDPYRNFAMAVTALSQAFNLVAVSSIKSTKPLGMPDQPDFLNAMALVSTTMGQEQTKAQLKQIETKLGRDHNAPKYGPRVIDLDIVMWNNNVVDNDYYTRDFIRDAIEELKQQG